MGRMKIWLATLLFAISAIGCSPGMHRAYRRTMIGVAIIAETQSVLQTDVALRHDPALRETNWFLGESPSRPVLAGAWALNVSLDGSLLLLPHGDDDPQHWDGHGLRPVPEWVMDVTCTLAATVQLFWAWNDTTLTDRRWWR